MKNIISIILYYSGISFLFFRLTTRNGRIRAINYHCTPKEDMGNFESHLNFYRKYFRNINLQNLENSFSSPNNSKPGILITFDDGLRSNYDYAVGLLDQFKFTGWFAIPVAFARNPSKDFAESNSIILRQNYSDNRYGICVDELVKLAKDHEIVCHTYSHYRFNEEDSAEKLIHEIVNSKNELEKIIKSKISCFCWVGGELKHYTSNAYKMIIEAGYNFSFTTNNKMIDKNSNYFNLNRTNIETSYPMHLVLFQLSGLMDMIYYCKRNKVKCKFK